MAMKNPYYPYLMEVREIYDETTDVRTLRLAFKENGSSSEFSWRAGQFGQFLVFGAGECPFTIANSPTRKEAIECSFKLMGKVTVH